MHYRRLYVYLFHIFLFNVYILTVFIYLTFISRLPTKNASKVQSFHLSKSFNQHHLIQKWSERTEPRWKQIRKLDTGQETEWKFVDIEQDRCLDGRATKNLKSTIGRNFSLGSERKGRSFETQVSLNFILDAPRRSTWRDIPTCSWNVFLEGTAIPRAVKPSSF